MPRPDNRHRDYKSAMGGMTLGSASSTGTGEQDIEDMEKNPMSKQKVELIRNEDESKLLK